MTTLPAPSADRSPASPDAPSAVDPAGLQLLLQRRSHHRLIDPAPDDEELAQMRQAVSRVPDFHHLQPYRFIAARGEGRQRLGQALQRAARLEGRAEKIIARAAAMPLRAPLVVIAVACPRVDSVVSEFDQILCAGATVLTLQLAARALGYSGIWRSGWPMASPVFAAELGLLPNERIVGLLYLGTPAPDSEEAQAPPASAPDWTWW